MLDNMACNSAAMMIYVAGGMVTAHTWLDSRLSAELKACKCSASAWEMQAREV
jgi:hypothetical protein